MEPNDVAYQKKGNFMSDAMMHMKFSFRGSIAPMTGAEYTKLFFVESILHVKLGLYKNNFEFLFGFIATVQSKGRVDGSEVR